MSKFVKDSAAIDARLAALDEQLKAMFAAKAAEPAPARLVELVDQLEAAAQRKPPASARKSPLPAARQADATAPRRRRG